MDLACTAHNSRLEEQPRGRIAPRAQYSRSEEQMRVVRAWDRRSSLAQFLRSEEQMQAGAACILQYPRSREQMRAVQAWSRRSSLAQFLRSEEQMRVERVWDRRSPPARSSRRTHWRRPGAGSLAGSPAISAVRRADVGRGSPSSRVLARCGRAWPRSLRRWCGSDSHS